MFHLNPLNTVTIWYFPSKFTQSHLRDIHYQRLAPNCCKSNKDVEAINWVNVCCGPYGTSMWPRRRMRHQSAVTNQACSGIPKQPESRPLTKAKCDAFVTSAYYREFKTVPEHREYSSKTKTLGSTSIRYRSDTKVSDQCLIDVNMFCLL